MSDVLVGPEAGAVPGARTVRRWTTATANAHGGAKLGDLLGDLYYALITSAIGFGMALGVAENLRNGMPVAPAHGSGPNLVSVVSWALLAGLGAVLSLAGRLGPVGVGGAEATWLLGLPVGRRGLLRPSARRLPALAAVVAALVVGVLDAGLLADRDAGHVLRAGLGAGLACAGIVLAAGVAQTVRAPRRAVALAGDAVITAAPVLALLAAVLHWGAPPLLQVGAATVGLGVIVVVGLAVVLDTRLAAIPARSLRESGSVTSHAAGALVSLDSRELGRVLTDSSVRMRRRRWRRLRLARGPASALLVADLMVLLRSPRHLVQLVVAALPVVLVAGIPQLAGPLGFIVALLVCGYVAASATAEGSRRAEMAPALDRLLPLDAKQARRLRQVVPAVGMLVWSCAAFAAIGSWAGDLGAWLLLAVAATPVWSAAAVRAAYRPAPNWGGPLVSTPAGALPGGVAGVLSRGPDVVILGLVPTVVAIVLGRVTMPVVGFQLAFAAICVLVASSTDTRSFMERMADASTPPGGAR